jgi:hypothetical protein
MYGSNTLELHWCLVREIRHKNAATEEAYPSGGQYAILARVNSLFLFIYYYYLLCFRPKGANIRCRFVPRGCIHRVCAATVHHE